jgi:hypothetical protein
MPIAHATAMFRISKVRECGGYDEEAKRAQDFALILKLAGKKMIALESILTYYRRQRPSPLKYIIISGRYGRLVRIKYRLATVNSFKGRLGLPGSTLVDTRSFIQWGVEWFRYR